MKNTDNKFWICKACGGEMCFVKGLGLCAYDSDGCASHNKAVKISYTKPEEVISIFGNKKIKDETYEIKPITLVCKDCGEIRMTLDFESLKQIRPALISAKPQKEDD